MVGFRRKIIRVRTQKPIVRCLIPFDVWFDSGSTYSSVVANRPEFNGQDIDMYLEGSDQHRGWFMSSLMLSTATDSKAPYKQVLTHGFTVDGQGRKMSKSIGNIVTPQEVMDKFGGDIFRFMGCIYRLPPVK